MSCLKSNHGWVIQLHYGSYLGPQDSIVDCPEDAQLFERLILVWPVVTRLVSEGFEKAKPEEWIDD